MQSAPEPPDAEEPRALVTASDDYTGTVSFRADGRDDFERLFHMLGARFPGA